MTDGKGAPRFVYLSGGVGGARLAQGLADVLPPESLTLVVNTGDDFEHWGLWISPDLDTVMYTLSGFADFERGWGLAGESFGALEMMRRYGAEDWFALGDRDLATHLVRTRALRSGATLTEVARRLRTELGVRHELLPMCDAPRATIVETASEGPLDFQTWLVRHRGAPPVRAVRFEGSDEPTGAVLAAIEAADIVLIGPSNPYVSIDPILTLRGVAELVATKPVVAVSPIVGGKAVKGPLAEMIPALAGRPPSASAMAAHYGKPLRGMVVETGDVVDGVAVLATSTVMGGRDDRARLAAEVVAFAEAVGS
jgi:LPPG:FO 2-phospho-L-lactate transferase